MRNFTIYLSCFLVIACNNLEDASLSKRNTFIKQFNGPLGLEAAAFEILPDGFLILGNMSITRDSVVTVIIKTDNQGNRLGDIRYFQGGSGKSIKTLPANKGYLIVGEQLKVTPDAAITDNIDVYSAHILHISSNLDSIATYYVRDNSPGDIKVDGAPKVDYKASSIVLSDNNNPIILGTYQNSLNTPIRPFLQELSHDLETIDQWYYEFNLIAKNWISPKGLHYNNGNLIWASSLATEQQSFDYSYISCASVENGNSYNNYSTMGQNSQKSLRVGDMQPISVNNSGYGMVGTSANANGTSANIFFMRVDPAANINESTIKYFDASMSERFEAVTESSSEIQDYGTAITATKDLGFVLAGHFATSPQKGNGLNDIILIKVDLAGNLIWVKEIGGIGSETISAIRETDNGNLILLGTNIIESVSSILLIKTDQNGQITN